ncbi:MAG: GGDEF domain-containing protein [Chloroflexaceae bacterium]|nr:GGDEF domain-containing protein [Chloroflexaceae bacterium]
MFHRLKAAVFFHPEDAYDMQQRRIFMRFLLVPALCVTFLFGIADLIDTDWLEASIKLGFAIFLLAVLFRLQRTTQPNGWYRLTLAVFAVLLVSWLFAGGNNGEKMLWLYIFPACALFALGHTEGSYWNIGLYLICLVVLCFEWPGRYSYSVPTILRFFISFAMVIVTAAIYEGLRHHFHTRLIEEQQVLLAEQQRLQQANARIERLASTDPLTGLYNRSILVDRLRANLASTCTTGSSLALILCDIDHFKGINDTYGHLVGDEMLLCTAHLLQNLVRPTVDWIVRYGGEEFLIVLPETDEASAVQLAEQMRQTLANQVFQSRGATIIMTASFGVVSINTAPANTETITHLLYQADTRLYQAKRTGRNRVVATASSMICPAENEHVQVQAPVQ